MPRGESGRVVVEIDPAKKYSLYERLDSEGITLKEWFLQRVNDYLWSEREFPLFAEQQVNSPKKKS